MSDSKLHSYSVNNHVIVKKCFLLKSLYCSISPLGQIMITRITRLVFLFHCVDVIWNESPQPLFVYFRSFRTTMAIIFQKITLNSCPIKYLGLGFKLTISFLESCPITTRPGLQSLRRWLWWRLKFCNSKQQSVQKKNNQWTFIGDLCRTDIF